jgi:hypothetical protein
VEELLDDDPPLIEGLHESEVVGDWTHDEVVTISLRNSTCLLAIPWARLESPVIFPPGCAKLRTNPFLTGSPTATMTMGIVSVA